MGSKRKKPLEFLQLTSTIKYPPSVKGELSTVHSTFIDQVIDIFDNTNACKNKIIHAFNCISWMYISKDSKPLTWDAKDPWNTFTNYDEDILEDNLKDFYINMKDIDWVDVPIQASDSAVNAVASEKLSSEPASSPEKKGFKHVPNTDPIKVTPLDQPATIFKETDKSDLYIQPPTVPRFDSSRAYASGAIDGTVFTVYISYPEIPTKQNEISATTDVNRMTDKDLIKLFPNTFIRTRAECMYQLCEDIELHPQLGLILPVHGFTRKQLIDNVIRYPHLFKLQKDVDGNIESFYSTIEIDGELHKISDVWKQLPESSSIPYTKEFIKEYVVRRYLLERDIKHIQHRYNIYGSLDPFLTLFTTAADYNKMGYTDAVELARSCVAARVNYKRTRNPVLRRLSENV